MDIIKNQDAYKTNKKMVLSVTSPNTTKITGGIISTAYRLIVFSLEEDSFRYCSKTFISSGED
jgi:hypothetical protein